MNTTEQTLFRMDVAAIFEAKGERLHLADARYFDEHREAGSTHVMGEPLYRYKEMKGKVRKEHYPEPYRKDYSNSKQLSIPN